MLTIIQEMNYDTSEVEFIILLKLAIDEIYQDPLKILERNIQTLISSA